MGRNALPGFKAAARSIAKPHGISIELAAAQLPAGTRGANPRLNRVKGR